MYVFFPSNRNHANVIEFCVLWSSREHTHIAWFDARTFVRWLGTSFSIEISPKGGNECGECGECSVDACFKMPIFDLIRMKTTTAMGLAHFEIEYVHTFKIPHFHYNTALYTLLMCLSPEQELVS